MLELRSLKLVSLGAYAVGRGGDISGARLHLGQLGASTVIQEILNQVESNTISITRVGQQLESGLPRK